MADLVFQNAERGPVFSPGWVSQQSLIRSALLDQGRRLRDRPHGKYWRRGYCQRFIVLSGGRIYQVNIVETIRASPFTPLCAPPVAASERLIAELKPP